MPDETDKQEIDVTELVERIEKLEKETSNIKEKIEICGNSIDAIAEHIKDL